MKENGDQNSSHKEVNVNCLDVSINEDIVLDKLLLLKKDKAQGPDEIHLAVVKNVHMATVYHIPEVTYGKRRSC